MKTYSLLIIFLLSISLNSVFAQDETIEVEQPNTLENQFQEMKSASNNYQIYKVVKETSLNGFWKSAADSLKVERAEVNELQAKVSQLNSEVSNLNSQVSERDSNLEEQEYQIEHMSFMGIGLTKATYITFTWILIAILFIAALILFFRFKSANKVTVKTKNEYSTLSEEYENHKKRARENESKIKRELQTEINTVQELKQKMGES